MRGSWAPSPTPPILSQTDHRLIQTIHFFSGQKTGSCRGIRVIGMQLLEFHPPICCEEEDVFGVKGSRLTPRTWKVIKLIPCRVLKLTQTPWDHSGLCSQNHRVLWGYNLSPDIVKSNHSIKRPRSDHVMLTSQKMGHSSEIPCVFPSYSWQGSLSAPNAVHHGIHRAPRSLHREHRRGRNDIAWQRCRRHPPWFQCWTSNAMPTKRSMH